MTSEARNTANQKNSRRSTGPKTERGKNASRKNALKHGLTAKVIDVLPGENQADFDNRLNLFIDDHPNLTATQMTLIKRIVAADWKLDRLNQAQIAAISTNMRHAPLDLDIDLRKNAEEIGRRLIFEPLDRCEGPEWREPITQERIYQRNHDYPAALKFEIERTAQGVDWMLDQWNVLRGMLRFYSFWHYPEKMTAVRLLGKRPEDLVEDLEVGMIYVACNIAHIKAWDTFEDCFQAKLGVIGRPMYKEQVAHMNEQVRKRFFPTNDPEAAFDWLDNLVTREIDRLTKLKAEVLQPIADADRADAVKRAMFDASPAGLAATRYEGALTRELHRSLNDLMKQRKCDNDFGPEFDAEIEVETAPEAAPEAPPAAPEPVVPRNEPIPQPKTNPMVTKPGPRLEYTPEKPSDFINVSAFRNEPSDGGKGSKTDPKPPR